MGGGSGGHVTPVVAVFKELKKAQPDAELRFWCDKSFGNQAKKIISTFDSQLPVSIVMSGKLRRYHHLSLLQHLLIPSVVFPNILDTFKVGVGFLQAFVKLVLWRPDAVFAKGGYVCLPVGFAARLLRIPLVIHDSDAHPGLTNRLLAPHATYIATGAPLKYYSYPRSRSNYVGIPVAEGFRPATEQQKIKTKQALGFDSSRPLVVVTGGGLGAKRINDAVAKDIEKITTHSSLLLISGVGQYDELRQKMGENTKEWQLTPFVSEGMADIMAAADVVVARAGATSILELAAVGAPTILVPNARLTGGHQVKNAKVYLEADAVEVANEEAFEKDSSLLTKAIVALLDDEKRRNHLSKTFRTFAKPNAAQEMATLILKAAHQPK